MSTRFSLAALSAALVVLGIGLTTVHATAPACVPPPPGLAGWWRAEGNALDSAGTNNGNLGGNATYGPGEVGNQGFAFDGTNSYVAIPPSPSLDVGSGPGLTIEGWILPQGDIGNDWACLAEWNDGQGNLGAHFWLSQPAPYPYLGGGPGCLFVNLVDTGFNFHLLSSPTNTVDTNGWQHVAVTYDKSSGMATLYHNGAVVASANVGTFQPQTSYGFNFGKRLSFGDISGPFRGQMDEMSLYNRALRADEIRAIYAAGGAGKCVSNPPPSCLPPPPGLASWWRAEGNALDAVGMNHPSALNGTTYAAGEVGTGFNFDGVTNYINIAATPSITVGLSNGFTVEGWIKPANITASMVIVEYERALGTYNSDDVGLDFSVNSHGLGTIDGNIKGIDQSNHEFGSAPNVITAGGWQHVALTYDRGSGMAQVYVNGTNVLATNIGSFVPLTTFTNVLLGGRTYYTSASQPNTVFAGGMDELSIYTRALTTDEIHAIYLADGAGKCTQSAISGCTAPPPGLVSWWRLEGNAQDSAGPNNGTPAGNVSYGPGKVGQGLVGDGQTSALNLGTASNLWLQNFTIETWARRASSTVVSYEGNGNGHFLSTGGPGSLGFYYDTTGQPVLAQQWYGSIGAGATVTDTNWHHLAVTKDQSTVVFYIDGTPHPAGSFDPGFQNGSPAAIGGWFYNGAVQNSFYGSIDEVSVYNRALSATEVQAIYAADGAGKCVSLVAPTITTQPLSVVTNLGATVSFSVAATGTQPLGYQWRYNGANLSGGTTNVLLLSNVQLTNAGTYSVVVSNLAGVATSSNAVLTVTSPLCTPPPTGIVSWWRAENNAADSIGLNDGTLAGNAAYAASEVGQGFVFDGNADGVNVGTGTNLWLQNFSVETWIKRASTSVLSYNGNGNGTLFAVGAGGGYSLYLDASGHPTLGKMQVSQVSANVTITDLNWHHIAVTKGGTNVTFYIDGTPYSAPAYDPGFTFGTAAVIGGWTHNGVYDNTFYGAIDELAVYNRALSAEEVQGIYTAGSAGKCFTPVAPVITTQPASVVTNLGLNAAFTVVATGTHPLSYQWRLNGTNLFRATTSALNLSNLQLTNSGTYSVVVSNLAGVAVSSNALLTVTTPDCVAPPTGIVSWWRAESNALDSVSANNGIPSSALAYGPGEVGQGFVLNGTTANVRVPYNPSLRLTNTLTLEAWVLPVRSNLSQNLITRWDAYSGPVQKCFALALDPLSRPYLVLSRSGSDLGKVVVTATNGLPLNRWTHLAGAYDGSTVKVYVNGSLAASAPYTAGIYPGTNDITLGSDGPLNFFGGRMDEISVYSRALSPLEIQGIYNATVIGKCTTPAFILTQPASVNTIEGSNVTFSVTAGGDPVLHYQWLFNGGNIPGATGTSLSLTNVQWTNSGSYSVLVANAFGNTASSNAVLDVDRIPVAQCASVVVPADGHCLAMASVDQGSFDPDGDPLTLSQSPVGPYPLGTNLVTLTVADGRGASNSCTALVVVLDQTVPTLQLPANIVVTNAHDAWTSVVTYAPTAADNCSGVGQPVCMPPSGTAFSLGTTTVNVSATDAAGNTAQGSFTVTVLSGNVPPVPIIEVHPLFHFPGNTNLLVIAPDNQQAKVVLDGSKSYDLDDTNFLSLWYEGTNLLSTNLVATVELAQGTNDITLWLDDTFPLGTNSASAEVEVISPAQAVALVESLLNVPSKARAASLMASLNAAAEAFKRGDFTAGLEELQAFEHQVSAQLAPTNPELADELTQAAQQIINALTPELPGGSAKTKVLALTHPQGQMHLKFAGTAGKTYLVQGSTNLVDWQTIGVATDNGDGSFDFGDTKANGLPARFYRVVVP